MRSNLYGKDGFTLVELLLVTGILGLVIGAIYSLYLTHMKTAYTQDEVVEVQQNLRIAMDAISRDLKMAGALIPYGTSAIDPASTANNLIINTGAPTDALVRINSETDVDSASNAFSTTVDSPDVLDKFAVGDTVRVIRPFDGSQPLDTNTMGNLAVKAITKATSTISLGRVDNSTFGAYVTIKNGDIISKISAAATARFDTITYSVGNCPVGSGLNESCLYRSVNGGAGDVIASNLATSASVPPGLSFASLTEDNYGTSAISAAQLTLTAVTRKKVSSTDTPKSRQLVTIVKLRNRRHF